MKTVIEMAREAGIIHPEKVSAILEAFAALVIKPWADQLEVERKKFQELNDVAALGMQHARAAEREACAKLADEYATWGGSNFHDWFKKLSADIRARGGT